ncbi:MAG: S41 family peptidase, partial [Sciscionella sp.]
VFTSDGKHLAFLSLRTFDPVYDAHVFDLSFPAACRPYLVPLGALTPSPFDPRLDGRPVGEDDDSDSSDGSDDGGKGGDTPPRTQVDIEGLTERVTPFPVEAGSYSSLRPVRGGLVWLRSQPSGVLGDSAATADAERPGPRLERFEFTKRKVETLLDEVASVEVSGDGKRVVVNVDNGLRVLQADGKQGSSDHEQPDEETDVDLSRIRVTVDPAAEWAQEYDEAGRLMRDHFWRADMGGVDWAATLARYRPLVEAVGTHDDLVDLLWEVQGELGTSHAYVSPPGGHRDRKRQLGLLGADLRRDDNGTWRVARVLPSDTSLPEARSPLAAPGVAVRAGDALLAVDGRPVDPLTGPSPLLVGTVGKPVELTVGPADGRPARHVVVVPLLDDKPLRYQAWVAARRDHVHQFSEGRVGYLHVPDMVATGWAQLHRDLHLEVRRDALVVDIRENRGGHLSQLVVEKLARKVIGWQTGRDGYRAETYPADAPRGPVVAIANEFSGSDGDIVNAAIKALGIGPVVGTRTWGGTIGIDMRYHLVDGTLVTQPRYATWVAGPGWGVENYGVEPDVEVVMTPQDWAADRDPQLDEGVRIALRSLAERPAATLPGIPPLAGS